MSDDTKTPVYLTRYQLKKLRQEQGNDNVPSPRNKIRLRSPATLGSSSNIAKFSRKVEKVDSTSEAKRSRKITSTKEVKGKTTTRKIKLSPDSVESKEKDSSSGGDKIILMSGIDMMFSSILEEANNRLKKKRSRGKPEKSETGNDTEEEEKVNDSEDEEWGEIEGLPEDIEYTEEEHEYMMKLEKCKQHEIVYMEQALLDLRKAEIPIRFKILNLKNLSDNSKSNVISRLDHFYTLDTTDNEYHKLSTWVETLEKIPFDKVIDMPVKPSSSMYEVGNFLKSTRNILDSAVFGHNEAKDKIITTIAKQISNPGSLGSCIGIQGPMGNGKTTLVKEGICKAMKRPFAFVALGGMQDSSYMMGHEYTYEGSKPGRIIEILTECGCMNPVIYFDELDKISKCTKGDEIENFLCHLTDTSQNSEFHDKYMSGINFDLSKVTFIFSYNEPSKVNPILLDRLYKINTDGFNEKSKLTICQDYLLPKILDEYNFNQSDITITKDAVRNIIQHCTDNEKGVRNLKRCVETVVSKINVLRYMYPEECYIQPKEEEKIEIDETTVKEEKTEEIKTEIPNTEATDVQALVSNTVSSAIYDVVESSKSIIETRPIVSKEQVTDATISLTISTKDTSEETSTSLKSELETGKTSESEVAKQVISDAEKSTKEIVQEFTADEIIKMKFKSFKLPFEVNEDNYKNFISITPTNPSIAHLYL